MIALTDVRKALVDALTNAGLNVSPGADAVPGAASIALFRCLYHQTFARGTVTIAQTQVRVIIARADEPSALTETDDALTYTWQAIEAANGPWLTLRVVSGEPTAPLVVGDSSYIGATFELEVHV